MGFFKSLAKRVGNQRNLMQQNPATVGSTRMPPRIPMFGSNPNLDIRDSREANLRNLGYDFFQGRTQPLSRAPRFKFGRQGSTRFFGAEQPKGLTGVKNKLENAFANQPFNFPNPSTIPSEAEIRRRIEAAGYMPPMTSGSQPMPINQARAMPRAMPRLTEREREAYGANQGNGQNMDMRVGYEDGREVNADNLLQMQEMLGEQGRTISNQDRSIAQQRGGMGNRDLLSPEELLERLRALPPESEEAIYLRNLVDSMGSRDNFPAMEGMGGMMGDQGRTMSNMDRNSLDDMLADLEKKTLTEPQLTERPLY